MALYGPNGGDAFIASIKERALKPGRWAWLGWVVALLLLVPGVLDHRPILTFLGSVGLLLMSVHAFRSMRNRRHWKRLGQRRAP